MRNLSVRLTAVSLILILFTGCAVSPAAPAADISQETAGPVSDPPTVTFTDDLGHTFTVERPERVVALIGSFADIWCLAGGQDVLVAATDDAWTSFELDLGENVSSIGGAMSPNLELILAADPDFILASSASQADLELLDTFEQTGVPTAYFDVQSLDEYLGVLDICTQLTGALENYDLYGTQVKERVEAAASRQDDSAPTVLYIQATGSSCTVKGSDGNVLGEMLSDLGCINVADGNSLLEDLSLEAIMDADPDYIFAVPHSADPAAAMETLETTLLSNPAWQSLRAVQNGSFYTLPRRLYNLKPNALWGEAYEGLADILYPN